MAKITGNKLSRCLSMLLVLSMVLSSMAFTLPVTAEDTVYWEETFDTLPESVEDGVAFGALDDTEGESGWKFAIGGSSANFNEELNFFKYNQNALQLTKDQNAAGDLYATGFVTGAPETGFVKVEFDYTTDSPLLSGWGTKPFFTVANVEGEYMFALSVANSTWGVVNSTNTKTSNSIAMGSAPASVYFVSTADGTTKLTGTEYTTKFTNGQKSHITVTFDLDAETYIAQIETSDGSVYATSGAFVADLTSKQIGRVIATSYSWAAQDPKEGTVTSTFDNIVVSSPEAVVPVVESTDITHSIVKAPAITFNTQIKASSLEGITLTNGETPVAITPSLSADGKTVIIGHDDPFPYGATMTLTLPDTIKSATNGAFEGDVIEITTIGEVATKTGTIWSENFDLLDANETAPTGWSTGVWYNNQSYTSWKDVGANETSIKVVDGKLVLSKQQEWSGTNDNINLTIPFTGIPAITKNYVAIEFDIKQSTAFTGSTYHKHLYVHNNSSQKLAELGFGNDYYGLADYTDVNAGAESNRRNIALITDYVGKDMHVEIVYDLENETRTYFYTIDGIRKMARGGSASIDGKTLDLKSVQFGITCGAKADAEPVVFEIDNLAVVEYDELVVPAAPEFASITPADGATDVAIGSDIAVTFDSAIDEATITGVKLFDGATEITAVARSLSADDKTVTINPDADLEYNKTYTVKITTDVKGANTLAFAEEVTKTFTTAEEPAVAGPLVTSYKGFSLSSPSPIGHTYSLTFDSTMDLESLSNITLVKTADSTPVALSVTLSSDKKTVSLYHKSLDYSTEYKLTVPVTVKSEADVFVTSPIEYTFTTKAYQQGIWSEDFTAPWHDIEADTPFASKYADNWEIYIAGNSGNSLYDADTNAFKITDKGLNLIKNQNEFRSKANLLAMKNLFDAPDTGILTLDFDYSISAPYQSYAYFPLVAVVNTKGEQMLSVNVGSTYYGIFVNPAKADGVYTSTQAYANTDNKYAFTRANADALAEICDGDNIHISILMDLDEKKYSVKLTTDGNDYYTPTALFDFDEDLSNLQIGRIILAAQESVQPDSVSDTPVTSTFDNIVLQIPTPVVPALASATIEDGEDEYGIIDVPVFTFDAPIKEATLDEITLEADGTPVEITPSLSVDGMTLTIDHAAFAYGTDYVLTLPATLKSTTNGAFAGEVINFTTIEEVVSDADTLWLETFDNGKNPAWGFDAGYGTAAAEIKALNKVEFKNGQVVFTKQQGAGSTPGTDNIQGLVAIGVGADALPESGYVSFEMDFEYSGTFKSSGNSNMTINNADGTRLLALSFSRPAGTFCDSTLSTENWTANNTKSIFSLVPDTKVHVQILFDKDTGKYMAFYTPENGTKTAWESGWVDTNATLSFKEVKFLVNSYVTGEPADPVTIKVDNLAVKKYAKPTATFSVDNNAEDVAIASDLKVTFAQAMNEASLSGITLKQGETAVVLNPVLDGNVLDLGNAALGYGAEYVLTIPSTVMSANGVPMAETTYTFTTEDEPAIVIPAPTVESIVPANGATKVAINSDIVVTFSKAIDVATIDGITLKAGETPVDFTPSVEGAVLTINPDADLANGTVYTLVLPATIEATDDGVFAGATYTFTTKFAPITEGTIWEEKFDVLPESVTDGVAFGMLNDTNGNSGWRFEIGGSSANFNEELNYFKYNSNVLQLTRDQNALGDLYAYGSFDRAPETGIVTVEFDYTMDKPLLSAWGTKPIFTVSNAEGEYMFAMSVANATYGVVNSTNTKTSNSIAMSSAPASVYFVKTSDGTTKLTGTEYTTKFANGQKSHITVTFDLDAETYIAQIETSDGSVYATSGAFVADLTSKQVGMVTLSSYSWAAQDPKEGTVTSTFDNIKVSVPETVVPVVESTDITHSIVKAPAITFNTPIKASSLAGITLTNGATPVAITPSLSSDGKTVIIGHEDPFPYGATMTLTLPDTIKSATNGAFAGDVIEITTIEEVATKTGTIWSENFDLLDANETAPTGWSTGVWYNNQSYTSWKDVGANETSIKVVDGKLILSKQQEWSGTHDNINLTIPFTGIPTITKDYVSIEFDVKQLTAFTGSTYHKHMTVHNNSSQKLAELSFGNDYYGLSDYTDVNPGAESNRRNIALITDYVGKDMHVEIVYDLENETRTYFYTIDGVRKMARGGSVSIDGKTLDLKSVQFGITCGAKVDGEPVVFEFDNFAVVEHDEFDIPAAPEFASITPADGATDVAIGSDISVTFDSAIDEATITGVKLFDGATEITAVARSLSADDKTVTINPDADLEYNKTYTVKITTDVKGANTLAFATEVTKTFTTEEEPVVVVPDPVTVLSTSALTDVAIDANFVVTFSKAIKDTTLAGITVMAGATPVDFDASVDGAVLTINPGADLAYETEYTVTLPATIEAADGGAFAGAEYTFTTVEEPIPAPTVVEITPANNATGVAVDTDIVIEFSKAMNVSTLTNITIKAGETPVAYSTPVVVGNVVTLTPNDDLAEGTTYTVTIPNTVLADDTGVFAGATYTFTTEAGAIIPDPVTVSSIVPADEATGIAIDANIVVTFSKAINDTTLEGITVMAGATPVAFEATVAGEVLTINPDADLAYETEYTVTLPATIAAADGGAFEGAASTFTTVEEPVVIPDPVTLVSVVPANAATDIAIDANIVVTFSKAIKDTTLAGITLKAGDLPVAFTASVDGAVLTINPDSDLANGTVYTLVLPATIVATDDGAFAGATSTFTTVAAVLPPQPTDDNTLWSEDFDGITSTPSGWWFSKAGTNEAANAINKTEFKDDKLVITKSRLQGNAVDGVTGEIPFGTMTMPTTGFVAFEFDYKQTGIISYTPYDSFIVRNTAGERLIALYLNDYSDKFLADATQTGASWGTTNNIADMVALDGQNIHIQILFDLDNDTYRIFYTPENGVKTESAVAGPFETPYDVSFGKVAFNIKSYTEASGAKDTPSVLEFDNFEIKKYAKPVATANIADGATDVALDQAIVVTFTEAMDESLINNITLKKGETPVELILTSAVDSKVFTFVHADFDSNAQYTLTVPQTVLSEGGLAMNEELVSTFTTTTSLVPTTPLVLKSSVADGATDVSVFDSFEFKFSTAMDGATLGNITLMKGASKTNLVPELSQDGITVTLSHEKLAHDAVYTLTIPVTVESAQGVAVETEVTYTFTTIEAPTPEVAESSVEDGDINVSVTDSITVTFTEEMDIDSMAGITLKQGETPVELEYSLSNGNKTVTLAHSILDYEAEYTLTLPVTVKSTENVGLAEAVVINFTTAKAPVSETTVLWSEDFTRTEADEGWTLQVKDANGTVSTWPEVSTEKEDKIELKDGKLVITKRQDCTGTDVTMVRIPLTGLQFPTSGVVAFEFDYKQNGAWASKYQRDFQITNNDGEILFGSCFGSAYYGFNDCTGVNVGSESIKNNIAPESMYKNKNIHVEIVYNIDAKTYEVYYTPDQGKRTLGTRGKYAVPEGIDLSMKNVQFTLQCSDKDNELPMVVEYDNLKVVAHPVPVMTVLPVEDGERGVSITDDLVIGFSEAMNAESLGNISIVQGDESVSLNISLSEDGKTVTIGHEKFAYNKTYVLTVPLTVKSVSGTSMTVQKTFTFVTEVPPVTFNVGSVTLTDENGDAITDLSTVTEVNAQVEITNATSVAGKKATIIVAMYDGDGLMKKIVCKQTTLGAAATTELLVDFEVDGAEADYTIEVMAVDDFNSMQAMMNAIKLP